MIDESDFWSTSDQLTQIHQWARARYAAPWAVFFAVLLRVSASTGPHVQLPGVIGGRASLNLMGAFVAPSGGGKGISDKVARLAWPANIKELPNRTSARTALTRSGRIDSIPAHGQSQSDRIWRVKPKEAS